MSKFSIEYSKYRLKLSKIETLYERKKKRHELLNFFFFSLLDLIGFKVEHI